MNRQNFRTVRFCNLSPNFVPVKFGERLQFSNGKFGKIWLYQMHLSISPMFQPCRLEKGKLNEALNNVGGQERAERNTKTFISTNDMVSSKEIAVIKDIEVKKTTIKKQTKQTLGGKYFEVTTSV